MKRFTSLILALILTFTFVPAALPVTVAADNGIFIDFEDGKMSGFEPWGDTKLTITTEQAHSGGKSLLITERKQDWNGVQLRIEKNIKPDILYDITMWVRLKAPDTAVNVGGVSQIGVWPNDQYRGFGNSNASRAGWTQIKGSITYSAADIASGFITISINAYENPNAEFYIDDISFKEAEIVGKLANAALLPSLREVYKNDFLIGNGSVSGSQQISAYIPFAKRNFDLFVLHAYSCATDKKGEYDFTGADGEVAFFESTGAKVHGHPLIWHETNAAWLNRNADGTPLTRAEAKNRMEAYIHTLTERYAGKMYSWDVLNEAVSFGGDYNGDWKDALRKKNTGADMYTSYWYLSYENGADKSKGESGADFIYDAFVFARLADPKAILCYNDYDETNASKMSAIIDMVKDINKQWTTDSRNTAPGRLLIETVGLQGHYNVNIDLNALETTIKRLTELGIKINVSELDVSIFDYPPPYGQGDWMKPYEQYRLDQWHWDLSKTKKPARADYEKQAEVYAKLFVLFKKYAKNIDRITFWGVDDGTSWLDANYPCIFDKDFNPKLAYFAVVDPEGYLAGNFGTEAKRNAWIEANSLPVPHPKAPNLDTATTWAQASIQSAYTKGFIPTDIQNTYTKNTTRTEFCRMAVLWLEWATGKNIDIIVTERGIPERKEHTFNDTTDANILSAYRLGIINGTVAPSNVTPGTFNPNGDITRQEAATMMRNVCKAYGADVSKVPDQKFTDINTAANWAVDSINFCKANGIITGTSTTPLTFTPTSKITREQSIMTFDNIKPEKLPKP